MTLTEAARVLGLSRNTLQIQARLGRLRATKHGRDYWVTEEEVARYAAEVKKEGDRK